MHKKELTLTSKLLIGLLAADDALSLAFPTSREFNHFARYGQWKNYGSLKSALYYFKRKGWIKLVDKNNQRFIKLTSHGELEALLSKACCLSKPHKWDGKWRVVIFDIPEESREKRHLLRLLLRRNGFVKLQASVFINPCPLNREAIRYLKESRLDDYIRILKVEEIDDDSDLRRRFNLPKQKSMK